MGYGKPKGKLFHLVLLSRTENSFFFAPNGFLYFDMRAHSPDINHALRPCICMKAHTVVITLLSVSRGVETLRDNGPDAGHEM